MSLLESRDSLGDPIVTMADLSRLLLAWMSNFGSSMASTNLTASLLQDRTVSVLANRYFRVVAVSYVGAAKNVLDGSQWA